MPAKNERIMWFDEAKKLIDKADGEVGLLVKNLNSGETFCNDKINERFPAASTIKVHILLALFDAAFEGQVDLNAASPASPENIVGGSGVVQFLSQKLPFTLLDHAVMMIDLSDNSSSNKLIDVLGIDVINDRCRKLGLNNSILARKFMDFEARDRGLENFTTCKDLLTAFEIVFNNPAKYELALKILKQQMVSDLLPFLTPLDEYEFAHKTGSLPGMGIRHDAGIMYLSDPVFIAFMTKGFKKDLDAIRLANDIGLLIYENYKT